MLYVFITNILAVAVVLGVMIMIHELGHFLAAKYFGIRVETFSIGFGKRIWGFKKGDTDYRLSVLPFGGYVKMAGENPDEAPTGNLDEFQAKPRWQRFIVAVAGPGMNIILSIVLLAGLFMYRYQTPAYEAGPAMVGWVEPDSPAAAAGLQPGDRVIRLAQLQDPKWTDMQIRVAASVGQALEVELDRNGERLTTTFTPQPEGRSELGYAGWFPLAPAKVQVAPDLPAAKAGVQDGDEIVSINGTRILSWAAISGQVQQSEGSPLEVAVRRGDCSGAPQVTSSGTAAAPSAECGEMMTVQITPVKDTAQGETSPRWLIGVGPRMDMITSRLGPVEALSESLATNKKFALLIFEFVGKMFTRDLSLRTMEGPIGIARLSGAAARESFADLISLMAAISLNLGIFNLFPIPVLDGGMILLLLIEGTIRRDLPRGVKERVTQVGFAFLMLIGLFVIYNDIVKALPERFEQFFP